MNGLGFTYFFEDSSNSPFISTCLGFSHIQPYILEYPYKSKETLGFTAGFGYEFYKHFFIEMDLGYGLPENSSDIYDDSRYAIMLTINWIGY